MIVFDRGRVRSVKKTVDDLDSIKKEVADLTDEERKVLEIMLAEASEGSVDLVEALENVKYKTVQVGIREWLSNDYFLGSLSRKIYPKLKDDLVELFEGDYFLGIMTGAIGTGKSTWGSIVLIRLLYELSCLNNPQASLSLTEDSVISLINISVTVKLAKKVIFGPIVNILKESPYFKEQFPGHVTGSEIRFPNNIWLAPATSSDTSVLGLNVYGGIVDEGNFIEVVSKQQYAALRKTHKLYSHVDALFDAIVRRMKSRYMRKGGKVSGKLLILSSKKTRNDFIYRLLREFKDDEGIFCRDYSLWDTKPQIFEDDDTFPVLVGNEIVQSRVIDEDTAKDFKDRTDVFVIRVPETLRRDFERDTDGALRDIAGIATVAITPFFANREKIQNSVEVVGSIYEHPFEYDEWDPTMPIKFHWDSMIKTYENGETKPKINPDAPRYAHIDIALRRDAAGLAVGHIFGQKEVDAHGKVEILPIFFMDLMLRIIPPVGGEILLSQLRQIIYELSAHGYHVVFVSLDSFQSADTIQQFRGQGYDSDVISVDASSVPYETLKDAYYEDRMMMYKYEIAERELRELEFNQMRKKVDHPEGGSKDVADGICGVVYSLSTRAADVALPIAIGSAYKPEDEYPVIGKIFPDEDDEGGIILPI